MTEQTFIFVINIDLLPNNTRRYLQLDDWSSSDKIEFYSELVLYMGTDILTNQFPSKQKNDEKIKN